MRVCEEAGRALRRVCDARSVPLGTKREARCECAEISFDEIGRRMREKGLTLDQACERTGCGRTCTACIPDLRAHLAKTR